MVLPAGVCTVHLIMEIILPYPPRLELSLISSSSYILSQLLSMINDNIVILTSSNYILSQLLSMINDNIVILTSSSYILSQLLSMINDSNSYIDQ